MVHSENGLIGQPVSVIGAACEGIAEYIFCRYSGDVSIPIILVVLYTVSGILIGRNSSKMVICILLLDIIRQGELQYLASNLAVVTAISGGEVIVIPTL
jgi:hypothetical protein